MVDDEDIGLGDDVGGEGGGPLGGQGDGEAKVAPFARPAGEGFGGERAGGGKVRERSPFPLISFAAVYPTIQRARAGQSVSHPCPQHREKHERQCEKYGQASPVSHR